MRINEDDYWDFYVNKDAFDCRVGTGKGLYDECLISYIDVCDDECVDGDWLYSESGYSWEDAVSSGVTLENISYTGLDNGLFRFRKDRISNKDFFQMYQDNKYELVEDDLRLKLHAVSGNTLQYEYPMSIEDCSIKLNGGFYQGFFKTKCGEYEVLPSKFENGDTLHFEFTLKKCDLEKESDKTLNDKYPENKGIFFYIGTRAENKWVYLYDEKDKYGLEECSVSGYDDYLEEDDELCDPDNAISNFDSGDIIPFEEDKSTYSNCIKWNGKGPTTLGACCDGSDRYSSSLVPFFNACTCSIMYKKSSKKDDDGFFACDEFGDDYIADFDGLDTLDVETDYIEQELSIADFEYETDDGFKLSEGNQYYFYTDNKFMFFDRTKSGYTVNNWDDDIKFMYYGRKNKFKGNLFILMNRTKSGYTVDNIDELIEEDANDYNPFNDIYDNALAFRVTDEGEIGYRLLTYDCGKEGDDKTSIIEGYSKKGVIKDCEWQTVNVRLIFAYGKMKIYFYVDGKLKYITKELPPISMKQLNDLAEKQEGVPYNISLGGGTQGLAETILPNYMQNPKRVYPLEKNFAGTFIGYISSFKIYNCLMEQRIIMNNYNFEKNRLS